MHAVVDPLMRVRSQVNMALLAKGMKNADEGAKN